MDRLEEIRQRTEAAAKSKDAEFDLAIHAPEDIPYLLSEVARLNTVRAEYTSNSAEITINGCKYVPKARAEAAEAERDAAIADLNHLTYAGARCEICKHYLDENCITCEFEWRGQQAGKGDSNAKIN